MLTYPDIKTVVFQIGPFKIYWYGIMYLLGFTLAWLLAKLRAKKYNWSNIALSDLIFYSAVGAILGGRLGYVLLYQFAYWLQNPLFIFKIWLGGMSFHGGLVGAILGLWLFAHKMHLPFLVVTDFTAPLAPPGIALGRIGNFINSELWGRITTVPWGMVFPNGGPLPRHPSQLYEALTEGLLLFFILWFYSTKLRMQGQVTAMFLLLYGCARFGCEFFREADSQIGYIELDWLSLSLGQLLSLPMIIIGIGMLAYLRKKSFLA